MAEERRNTAEWQITPGEYAKLERLTEEKYGHSFIELASGNALIAFSILKAHFGTKRVVHNNERYPKKAAEYEIILSIFRDPEISEFIRRIIKEFKTPEAANEPTAIPFISFRIPKEDKS
jgi:hypothetical protein